MEVKRVDPRVIKLWHVVYKRRPLFIPGEVGCCAQKYKKKEFITLYIKRGHLYSFLENWTDSSLNVNIKGTCHRHGVFMCR